MTKGLNDAAGFPDEVLTVFAVFAVSAGATLLYGAAHDKEAAMPGPAVGGQ